MSTTTIKATIGMSFEDETTRTYEIPNIEQTYYDNPETMRERVKAVNNGSAANIADFRKTFVSNGGASFRAITSAGFVTTTEEVIYNG